EAAPTETCIRWPTRCVDHPALRVGRAVGAFSGRRAELQAHQRPGVTLTALRATRPTKVPNPGGGQKQEARHLPGFLCSTGRASLPYTGNLAQMALTFSRTASITASLFRSARMSQIQPASSRHSASLKPRVVTAGVPMRRPEVTNGERGSFG